MIQKPPVGMVLDLLFEGPDVIGADLRSAAIRSASAFMLARCSSESRPRASSRLMTSKNAAVCNPC